MASFLLLLILSLIGMILYTRGTFRFVYLVQNIRGPSLWKLVTVHAKKFLTQMLHHVCEQCEHYAYQPWGFWTMTGDYVVVISSLECVSEMYRSKNLTTKPDLLYSSMEDYVGEGSIVLRGSEKWRTRRKIIMPAFQKSVLELNIDIISNGAENILQEFRKFADGPSFDITRIINHEFTDIVIRFLTSNRLVMPDIPRYSDLVVHGIKFMHLKTTNPLQYWFQQIFHKTTRNIERLVRSTLAESRTIITRTTDAVTTEMKTRAEKEPRDLLEACLKNLSKQQVNMGNEEIGSECINVVAAAIDTTKTTTKMAILLLALHQEMQQRVFDELDDIFGGSDEPPTPQDLDRMEYLGMVIKETLRLFPSVPMIARKAVEETNLNGTIIPKGAIVLANFMAVHRNPHNFENPMEFIPERFLPELSAKRHPYSYIPFSSGIRNCVGKLQGIMTTKNVLSSILRRYKVLPGEGMNSMDDIKVEYHLTLGIPNTVIKLVSRK